jgi:hypothetical protein
MGGGLAYDLRVPHSALDALLATLSGHDHWRRVEAIEALGRLGDPAAGPALVEVLEEPRECRHTRAAALGALFALGVATGARAIKRTALGDPDSEVRAAAARALGRLAVPGAAATLRHVAEHDADADVAAAARAALTELHSNGGA